MTPFWNEAQAKVDALVQTTTQRMALGLVAGNLALGLYHQATVPPAHMRALLPLASLGSLSLVAVAWWLRQPRSHLQVRMCEGTAALLAAATSLLDLHLEGSALDTSELMLIQVGAGFFLLSTYWWGIVSLLVLAGWAGVAWEARQLPQGILLGVPLVLATAVGLLLHLSRRRIIHDMVDLEARELEAQAKQRRLAEELQGALDNLRTLRGLIPICAKCKKIRDDKGFWQQVETYVEAHSHAAFSHGLCPHCLEATRAEWEQALPE